jgi:hypothetical protein
MLNATIHTIRRSRRIGREPPEMHGDFHGLRDEGPIGNWVDALNGVCAKVIDEITHFVASADWELLYGSS